MQFRIRTLLVLTTAISVLLALVFAAPPVLALPLLCMLLWVCPAFWINGIVYGRGAWRPFFIGGVAAGIGPHLAVTYYSAMLIGSEFGGNSLDELLNPGSRLEHLMNSLILLSSGPFAITGGLIGVGVYWMFGNPPATKAASSPFGSVNGDQYVVVTGRISARELVNLAGDKEPLSAGESV